jgi:hypothetical protein
VIVVFSTVSTRAFTCFNMLRMKSIDGTHTVFASTDAPPVHMMPAFGHQDIDSTTTLGARQWEQDMCHTLTTHDGIPCLVCACVAKCLRVQESENTTLPREVCLHGVTALLHDSTKGHYYVINVRTYSRPAA